MAKIDQSTRRGRLTVVFIGGMILFGGLTLAGFYLSNQRQSQLETAEDGGSQVTTLDDMQEPSSEVAGDHAEEAKEEDASNSGEEAKQDDDSESTESVASTGPSNDGGAGQLPSTGPSSVSEGTPAELPATGPEAFWIAAIIGTLIVGYLSFEYRRSRLAFQRAALRRQ